MKTLSLSRPLIIMLVGLPGAGKSFFARQFSETFSVSVASSDRVRYELFADPQFTNDENDIVSRMQDYIASELVKSGRSFMVDGGCSTRTARQKFEMLAKTNGYGTLVVWVQTDPTTARQRALKRSPQKQDDAYNASLNAEQFDTFSKRFDAPTKEQHVVISGRHTYSTQARTVLRKLAAPRAETVQVPNANDKQVVAPERAVPKARPRDIVVR